MQADWLHSPTLNKNEFATRTYDDGTVIVQQVKRNRDTDYATVNAGVDHEFNDDNTLSVSGLFNREKIIDNGDNPYFDGSLQDRYRLWQFLEDEVKYTAFGTAVLTHRFPQPGHTLTVTSNYSFHREDEQYFFTNTLPTFVGEDAFKLLSDEHVVDLKADYVKPLRQGRVEAGFKGRYRSIPVNMQFFAGPEHAHRYGGRRLGRLSRDHSRGVRHLRVREPATRTRRRGALRERWTWTTT